MLLSFVKIISHLLNSSLLLLLWRTCVLWSWWYKTRIIMDYMSDCICNLGCHPFTSPPKKPHFNFGTVDRVITALEFYILFWRNFFYLLLLEKTSLTLVILVLRIKRIIFDFNGSLFPVIFLFRLFLVMYGYHHMFCHLMKNYITAFLLINTPNIFVCICSKTKVRLLQYSQSFIL